MSAVAANRACYVCLLTPQVGDRDRVLHRGGQGFQLRDRLFDFVDFPIARVAISLPFRLAVSTASFAAIAGRLPSS